MIGKNFLNQWERMQNWEALLRRVIYNKNMDDTREIIRQLKNQPRQPYKQLIAFPERTKTMLLRKLSNK